MKNLDKSTTHPLQSRQWGEFRKAWGNEVVWTKWGLLTLHKIPFTSFKIGMFIKGPVPTQKMLDGLKKLAQEKNLIFIKLEPNYAVNANLKSQNLIDLLMRNGAVRGKTLFTPTTFWIDLTKSEEELLASFHPKTRYNIRLAQKKGVTVEEDPPAALDAQHLRAGSSEPAFEKYLSLMAETVSRQGFYAHNRHYHQLMWKTLKNKIAHLLVAKYKGEIIASWIVFAYDGFLYYPYGASSSNPDHYRLMPSALLMWEAIRLGKKLGLTTFDLWGREPDKGFTKFKEGYNPQVVEFLGTWDLITSPLYWLYRVAESVRWVLLRTKAKLGLSKYHF